MRKLSTNVRKRLRPHVDHQRKNIFLRKDNLITLIRFYAGHECLWNQFNPDYHNEKKRNYLWSWIAKQFGQQTSKYDVEWEIKVLQGRALREFERMKLYRRMGVKCSSTFDLLDEFQFLLDDGEEVINPVIDETQVSQHHSSQTFPDTSDTTSTANLDMFCNELKEQLSQFPPNICLKAQKKILFVMHSARIEFDQIKAKPKSKKYVHWNI